MMMMMMMMMMMIQTSPEAHPASYTVGIGLFLGIKRPGCGVNNPPPSEPSLTFNLLVPTTVGARINP